jgi:hypothetical protein
MSPPEGGSESSAGEACAYAGGEGEAAFAPAVGQGTLAAAMASASAASFGGAPPPRVQDPSRTVFVGGLPPEATEPVLRVFFQPFGTLTSVRVRCAAAAPDGISAAGGFCGALRCSDAPAAAPPWLGSAQLISDPRTGRSKGYAFVTFTEEAAAAAVKARGKLDVYGRTVDVGAPQGSRPPGTHRTSAGIPADRRAFVGGLPREVRRARRAVCDASAP